MKPYEIHHGDCLDVLKTLADCSVDAIVTDPPYGLSFMGKRWDYDVPSEDVWRECLRVLKPGGHLLAFAGTRTQHRMAVRIEDAGFEIRDMIAWVYGSGFPKSLDVSKAMDKSAGAEREKIPVGDPVKRMIPGADQDKTGSWIKNNGREYQPGIEIPATESAKQWQGWGTALKPAMEPLTVARKPLIGTVAENVLEHGTGGLNIDGCRVAPTGESLHGGGSTVGKRAENHNEGWQRPWMKDESAREAMRERSASSQRKAEQLGRWPANFIHDGSEDVVALFPEAGKSQGGGGLKTPGKNGIYGNFDGKNYDGALGFGDSGSAARFFYCAKASKKDRDEGCDNMPLKECGMMEDDNYPIKTGSGNLRETKRKNAHPTVKPTDLMRYLCRLVTPPNGIVLDPFMGSGSTGKAAMAEGFRFIGIEQEAEYIKLAEARIDAAVKQSSGLLF